MILMNYRTIPVTDTNWFLPQGVGGTSTLGISSITFGNTTIGSSNGITALNLWHAVGRSKLILEHEFCHKLFGEHIPLTGVHSNIGMMTPGHNGTTYIMTPMERSAPILNYIPINLIDQTGIYTDTLPDYTESGISYKIKIPGTSSEYVWIANHQKKSLYDGVSRGGSNCYDINFAEIDPFCPDGKGLYVYRQGSGCSNLNQPYDVVTSEGRFDWSFDRSVTVPLQNYHHSMGGNISIFITDNGSRYNGRDEYAKYVGTSLSTQILTDDVCSLDPDDYSIAWNERGDGLDAFNIGYEEIFSPYSNPSSSSCNSGNTGLTIALTHQNSTTGAIIVKVYYDNNTTALHDLPPSKPKNIKVTEDFISQYSYHPEIKWDANIEPDFVSATYGVELVEPEYEIYRGYSADCNVEPDYTLLTTLASNITEYIDNSVTLYTHERTYPGQGCNYYLRTYSYKVAAIDNRGARSLKSERGLTTGFTIACSSEDPFEDNILNCC